MIIIKYHRTINHLLQVCRARAYSGRNFAISCQLKTPLNGWAWQGVGSSLCCSAKQQVHCNFHRSILPSATQILSAIPLNKIVLHTEPYISDCMPSAIIKQVAIHSYIQHPASIIRGHFLRERVGTEYPHLLNAWERRSHTSREK